MREIPRRIFWQNLWVGCNTSYARHPHFLVGVNKTFADWPKCCDFAVPSTVEMCDFRLGRANNDLRLFWASSGDFRNGFIDF